MRPLATIIILALSLIDADAPKEFATTPSGLK